MSGYSQLPLYFFLLQVRMVLVLLLSLECNLKGLDQSMDFLLTLYVIAVIENMLAVVEI